MRYRKIVREVEAYQLTAAMIDAHLLDEAPLPKGLRLARAGYHRGNRVVYNATFSVTTIHGEDARVVVNDWIITEMDGEHFYPCKPEIFAVDYEAVGAPHPELGSGALRERLTEHFRRIGMGNACQLADIAIAELSLSSPIEPPPDRSIEWNIRSWLWDTHGHTMLYGDDGEMQCKECPLDYKRAPLIECFERANTELGLVRVKASRAQASSEIRERIHEIGVKYGGDNPATVYLLERAIEDLLLDAPSRQGAGGQ